MQTDVICFVFKRKFNGTGKLAVQIQTPRAFAANLLETVYTGASFVCLY